MAVTYSYYQDAAGQWWRFSVQTDGTPDILAVSAPGTPYVPAPGDPAVSPSIRQCRVLDLISNALAEINACAVGETPSSADCAFALNKLNRILDNWNAEGLYVYDVRFDSFTLTPGHQPHSIGPVTADFVMTPRPVEIQYANLLVNGLRFPLEPIDDGQWASIRIPALATNYPRYLHYHKDWPNGLINLWPVPTAAWDLELVTRTAFNSFLVLSDPISFPPGYEDAMTLTLAVALCPAFNHSNDPELIENARQARNRIKMQNAEPPLLSVDPAVGGNSGGSGYAESMARLYSGGF